MTEQQSPEPISDAALESIANEMSRAVIQAFQAEETPVDRLVIDTGAVSPIPLEQLIPHLQKLLPTFMTGTAVLANEVLRLRRIIARFETEAAGGGPEESSH